LISVQENRLRIRTYRQVWHLEQVIYQIERVRLPFPVTFRQIGVFAAALLVMVVVSRVGFVGALSPVLRYALIPGGVTWYLTSQRLDGKPPHRWILSMLRYWGAPKRLSRLRPMNETQRVRLTADVGYRLVEGSRVVKE
jgi:hypothetical protein